MDRKAVARETLKIMENGCYQVKGKQIDISAGMESSIKRSCLFTPEQGQSLLEKYGSPQHFPYKWLPTAHQVMRNRMKLALAIFAEQGAEHLVLGAYGCGVFRNDPDKIALWWKELLEEGMGRYFKSVFHAVLDRSRTGNCIAAFKRVNG